MHLLTRSIYQAASDEQKHDYDKGSYFTSVEEAQTKTENILKGLSKTSYENCYQQWQHQVQKCVKAEKLKNFEDENVTKN
ncbi:hypothetical protein TNCV_1153231 [Trichonephila clavipes]|nr:hypothetical protein TNCV_1153231 [Trichonephila clavipes]